MVLRPVKVWRAQPRNLIGIYRVSPLDRAAHSDRFPDRTATVASFRRGRISSEHQKSSPTEHHAGPPNGGPILLAEGIIKDTDGNPIEGAEIDIWQTAPNGLYASQDDAQDTYSFHGLMTVGTDGRYAFTTVKPVEYTVPMDGPVGDILRACGRHPWRPSHLHYIVKAPGYKSLVTEIFPDDDLYLDQDAVFGVRDDLVMEYHEKPAADFPDGMEISGKVAEPYLYVSFDVTLIAEDA